MHTIVKDNLAKLAVVVSLETKENSDAVKTFGKQLSMHIAASNPLALESEKIDKDIFASLSYNQWTLKEFESGEAWEYISKN